MRCVAPAMRWGKTIQNLKINCFNKWCRIVSNRKINPTQHATGCWWLLLVFYYPRHMPPSVFIHFKAVSCFFFQKTPTEFGWFLFSVENLNKGSKGWRPFHHSWNFSMDHLLPKVECPDFWIGDGCPFEIPRPDWAHWGLGGAVWGSCDCDVVVGSQPFEGNKHKGKQHKRKGFQRLASFRCTEKHLGLPGNKEH